MPLQAIAQAACQGVTAAAIGDSPTMSVSGVEPAEGPDAEMASFTVLYKDGREFAVQVWPLDR